MNQLELAEKIPSQNNHDIKIKLYEIAQDLPENLNIVELGPWLGSVTAFVSAGLNKFSKNNKIYVYERFKANESEVQKAAKAGLKLEVGDCTENVFRIFLEPFNRDISVNRCDLNKVTWNNGPIGLYIDDAAKQDKVFNHCMEVFEPSFIPGTIIALLDYFYYETTGKEDHKSQRKFMERHCNRFKFLCRMGNGSAAIFKYKGV